MASPDIIVIEAEPVVALHLTDELERRGHFAHWFADRAAARPFMENGLLVLPVEKLPRPFTRLQLKRLLDEFLP